MDNAQGGQAFTLALRQRLNAHLEWYGEASTTLSRKHDRIYESLTPLQSQPQFLTGLKFH